MKASDVLDVAELAGEGLAKAAGVAAPAQVATAKIVGYALLGALVALILGTAFYWVVLRPQMMAAKAAQAHAGEVLARHDQAGDMKAFKIVDDTRATNGASDKLTGSNDHAIKQAADAATHLPGVYRSQHDALCLRTVYQSELDCQALRAAAQGDASARPDAGGAAPGG